MHLTCSCHRIALLRISHSLLSTFSHATLPTCTLSQPVSLFLQRIIWSLLCSVAAGQAARAAADARPGF